MKLIIVSGRSGSGKSTALHVLEDLGFYCIDNLPIGLLFPLTQEAATKATTDRLGRMAVSIDARNLSGEIANFEDIYSQLQETGVEIEIIFLDADEQSLLQRFHATRRKHPLSDDRTSLREAISNEKNLLEPLSKLADLYVNTAGMSIYELRDQIKQRVVGRKGQELALLFQSFGYKHGVPLDSDYVFDVRCLPNPYWDTSLRKYVGTDQPVIEFLERESATRAMVDDLTGFLATWLPSFADSNRSYMTISIGCTGGQHRSVYVCEQLGRYFREHYSNVQVRHSELPHLQAREEI
ncbi:glmZ(sRNA)-inactivating NTPase [Marinobacter santoriniensis NKSG1]|uniref:GlmZ(SRNA)-inactivating NTPase n=1 Tax=Marinobacter santoriniensis NKSG1 TaxID=1288826 RepID=M7CS65_9GAMM|nr:RNase adapter RapZ [Marinobacter santoriniensis]EMP56004.1 glmZ(sRNA)-inactivating NTPase [Marinobacter santoriniensis NKSG1]